MECENEEWLINCTFSFVKKVFRSIVLVSFVDLQ